MTAPTRGDGNTAGSTAGSTAGKRNSDTPRVVIIGGGGTGAAVAYELAHRGVPALLLERGSLTCGTTGRHHGLLHSGARYLFTDQSVAAECWEEAQILRRITHHVIEDNGGLFVSLEGDERVGGGSAGAKNIADKFADTAHGAGIPIKPLTAIEIRDAVPGISERVDGGFWVPDASFDAWRLPMQFFASALAHGAVIRQFCEVTGIEYRSGGSGAGAGGIQAVTYRDHQSNTDVRVPCDVVINACGVWSPELAEMCGVTVPVNAQSGTMIAVRGRLTDMVINRLAPPGDGDIIVPQRQLSIIGTTSIDCTDIEHVEPTQGEIDGLLSNADRLMPSYSSKKIHAVWAAARPLFGGTGKKAHGISRKSACLDHGRNDNIHGLFTITGGKATTMRAMAVDLVKTAAPALGKLSPSRSHDLPLQPFRDMYALMQSTGTAPPWQPGRI